MWREEGRSPRLCICMLARYPQSFHPSRKSIECFSLIFPQGLLFVKCVSSWVKHILKLSKHDITCIPEFTGPSVEPKFRGVAKDFIQMSGVIGVSSTTLGEPPTLCELWLHQLYKYSENCVFWQSVSVTINQEWIAWDKYMWVSCLIHQVTFTTARLVLLWKVMIWENPGTSFPTSPLMVSNCRSRDGIYRSRDQESWVKVSVKKNRIDVKDCLNLWQLPGKCLLKDEWVDGVSLKRQGIISSSSTESLFSKQEVRSHPAVVSTGRDVEGGVGKIFSSEKKFEQTAKLRRNEGVHVCMCVSRSWPQLAGRGRATVPSGESPLTCHSLEDVLPGVCPLGGKEWWGVVGTCKVLEMLCLRQAEHKFPCPWAS